MIDHGPPWPTAAAPVGRCRYMTCQLGGVIVCTSNEGKACPVCEAHGRLLLVWLDRGATIHVTPDGALYVGDLDDLLPDRP